MALLKIGELAKRAGCLVETIRFYERDGLLPAPVRSTGNYRLYDEALLERLQFIRRCRSLDMSLGELARLLGLRDSPQEDCGEVNALLDRHIDEVTVRLRELAALNEELRAIRVQCG